MIQVCIILFQRMYEDKYETEPTPFFGETEADAVSKIKQYMIDTHEVQYSYEDDREMEERFNTANDFQSLHYFFDNHYCYYDISVHEVIQ